MCSGGERLHAQQLHAGPDDALCLVSSPPEVCSPACWLPTAGAAGNGYDTTCLSVRGRCHGRRREHRARQAAAAAAGGRSSGAVGAEGGDGHAPWVTVGISGEKEELCVCCCRCGGCFEDNVQS